MPVTANQLQEEVDQMEVWAEILGRMTKNKRTSISEACQKIVDFTKGRPDPLLNPSINNPYLKKVGGQKKTCGCF